MGTSKNVGKLCAATWRVAVCFEFVCNLWFRCTTKTGQRSLESSLTLLLWSSNLGVVQSHVICIEIHTVTFLLYSMWFKVCTFSPEPLHVDRLCDCTELTKMKCWQLNELHRMISNFRRNMKLECTKYSHLNHHTQGNSRVYHQRIWEHVYAPSIPMWRFPSVPRVSTSRGRGSSTGQCQWRMGNWVPAAADGAGSRRHSCSKLWVCSHGTECFQHSTADRTALPQYGGFDCLRGQAPSNYSVLRTLLTEELKSGSVVYWARSNYGVLCIFQVEGHKFCCYPNIILEGTPMLQMLVHQLKKCDCSSSQAFSDFEGLWTCQCEQLKSGCPAAEVLSGYPVLWTTETEAQKKISCCHTYSDPKETSILWRPVDQWNKFDWTASEVLSDGPNFQTFLDQQLKYCCCLCEDYQEISVPWKFVPEWMKSDLCIGGDLSHCLVLQTFQVEELKFYCGTDPAAYIESSVGRLQQEENWWNCSTDPVSPETRVQWSCQLWGMWFYCCSDSASHIESGDWRLQQGWRWWHSSTDEPPEPQHECHVAPQWGNSGFCRTSCLMCSTHFCRRRLYIEHLPPGVQPEPALLKCEEINW